MKRIFLLFTLIGFITSLNAQTINTSNSKVKFEVGNMKVNTVEGTFTGMNGSIKFNIADLKSSNFNVCIDAATVNTGNKKRDEHLRNEDFFDVKKYPQICFVSNSIEKKADGFVTTGNLTMHGVTKPVSIPFTFNNNTFEGKFTVKRRDYKVGEDTGNFMVSDDVELTIICQLN